MPSVRIELTIMRLMRCQLRQLGCEIGTASLHDESETHHFVGLNANEIPIFSPRLFT